MPTFRTSWAIVDELQDAHLIRTRWTPVSGGIRTDQLIVAGHIHPDLLRDLDEYFRHLSGTDAFELHPELAAAEPEFRTQYELVDPALLPLRTFGTRVSRDRKHYTFCVRRDMMSEALVREINTDFLPSQEGALRTKGSVPQSDGVVDLQAVGQGSAPGLTMHSTGTHSTWRPEDLATVSVESPPRRAAA
ncbi:hypothetical protein ABZ568_15045 [Streptomyces olindensis]|uniref:Uncharacterized protein n=1 Tax=Streptomyces olindensis TaxID=358823 RepID=A0ABV2XUM8_9ACTN|nr:hypothetical protein DF19_15480 [Streptomyces olindensis]